MVHRILRAACLLILCSCGSGDGDEPTKPPVTTEAVAHESDLLKLKLTPQAERRLGLRVERIGASTTESRRMTSGEVVVPNASGGVPTSSTSNLAQIGTQQATADGEVARTEAQVRLARIALGRASALVAEEAGSIRARDEAAAALATAQAQADAARAQRRLLGPAVAALGNQSTVWVRVPVFGTDLSRIDRGAAAEVAALGGGGAPRAARAVQAPPSANAVAGTVDLYYAIDNRDRGYRIGQRVSVALPMTGTGDAGLSVPRSAIVRDMYGGEWVYERTASHTYVRQRIAVASTAGNRAILSHGLARGAPIVSVGAMELFGSEFGVAH